MSRERADSLLRYLEIAGLVAAMALCNIVFWPRNPGFVGVRPHPMLFVALLVVARYGFFAGVVAASACAAEYAAMFLLVGKRPLYELVSGGNAAPLIVLVPTTIFFGMLVQHHIDRRRRADTDSARARRDALNAEEQLASLRDINIELGKRVINAQSTRLSLLDDLEPLLAADPAHLNEALATVVASVLHAESAAVWRTTPRPPAQVAHAGRRLDELPPDVERLFGDGDVLAAYDAPGMGHALPLLLGRVRAGRGGPVVALVGVDGISLQAAPEAIELFGALVAFCTALAGRLAAIDQLRGARARSQGA